MWRKNGEGNVNSFPGATFRSISSQSIGAQDQLPLADDAGHLRPWSPTTRAATWCEKTGHHQGEGRGSQQTPSTIDISPVIFASRSRATPRGYLDGMACFGQAAPSSFKGRSLCCSFPLTPDQGKAAHRMSSVQGGKVLAPPLPPWAAHKKFWFTKCRTLLEGFPPLLLSLSEPCARVQGNQSSSCSSCDRFVSRQTFIRVCPHCEVRHTSLAASFGTSVLPALLRRVGDMLLRAHR